MGGDYDLSRARQRSLSGEAGKPRKPKELQKSQKPQKQMTGPLVSVVIPVLHDTAELVDLLDALGPHTLSPATDGDRICEVIVANGDEQDESVEAVREGYPGVRWVTSPPGRARQMNAGARLATGTWLLFLHADTVLHGEWPEELRRVGQDTRVCAGAFRFTLRSPTRTARLVERGVGWRVRWLGLPYGDQGLFVRRAVFEQIGGYRLLPFMEDVDLVRRLWRTGRMVALDMPIVVSARRWDRDGWLRRTVSNMLLLGLYFLGVSPWRLAGVYYSQSPSLPVVRADRPRALPPTYVSPRVVVIVPALDEEEAIGQVLSEIPSYVASVVVVDNGSTDATADIARGHGAVVVSEPRRGYGRACLAGLSAVPDADIVVFLDADRSDYPADMTALVEPILTDEVDLVIGYRGGVGRPAWARLGTATCVGLINRGWHACYRDLGPFRAVRRAALDRLAMSDQTYGWTIEMQVKAAEANLRVLEVPIAQRERVGRSKISGSVGGTVRAGKRMLATIWVLWRTRRAREPRMATDVPGVGHVE